MESFVILVCNVKQKQNPIHRIINDRIEKYEPYIVFSQSRIAAMKKVLPWRTLRPPLFPTPGRTWGMWGGRRVRQGNSSLAIITTCGRNAEQTPPPFPSMSNLYSLYTLFYSVIF